MDLSDCLPMDLGMDFSDWTGLNGDVVEVRNTFLHVRKDNEGSLDAAVRSDFIVNYRDYPDLSLGGTNGTPMAKSKNKRPGKKARIRMRRNTLTSMSSDAPLEPCLSPSLPERR